MIGENFVGKDMVLAILNKSADAVTEGELAILRGRISYLTPEEIERFGLDKKQEVKVPELTPEPSKDEGVKEPAPKIKKKKK